jgi:hypothetical protein
MAGGVCRGPRLARRRTLQSTEGGSGYNLPQMPPLEWWLSGAIIVTIAFLLRIAVHAGRTPGGVDTWYYLAYADAVRKKPGFDVRLPQYLLQDERQSYPPLFPMLLALLPGSWLRRYYWVVSPAIDCVHLLLLHYVSFRITASLPIAVLASSTYAFTPQLVSETRSLSARPFGALLHTLAILCALKATVPWSGPAWLAGAVLAAAALFLSSAGMSAAYGFVGLVLALVFQDLRYLAIAGAGALVALVVSGGHLARVVRNYVYAVEYWRRNRHLYGAHPIHDSPIYGRSGAARKLPQRPGFLGTNTLTQAVRLFGENPFLLALPLASFGIVPWGPRIYAWALSLAGLSVVATLVPPLRAFGPGRSYMKAAVFPTAYTLAFAIGSPVGLTRPVGIVTLACLGASLLAVGFFLVYTRRLAPEQTASVPPGLAEATAALAALPGNGGVLVLPFMYADYVCYHSGKPVLWGGHCGDLRRFEAITPVLRRPVGELALELRVTHALIDASSGDTTASRLGLTGAPLGRWDGLEAYDLAVGRR